MKPLTIKLRVLTLQFGHQSFPATSSRRIGCIRRFEMDPNVCWSEILKSRSPEHIAALAAWLDFGGFEPTGFDPETFGHLVEQVRRTPK